MNLLRRKLFAFLIPKRSERDKKNAVGERECRDRLAEILDIFDCLQKPALCFLVTSQTFTANGEFFRVTGIPFSSVPRWIHEFPFVGQIVLEENTTLRLGGKEYRLLSCPIEEAVLFVFDSSPDATQWFSEIQFFLTALGHELKTPLTILKGYVQILQDEIVPEKRETVLKLQEQIVRLEETLNNFRSLSLLQRRGHISWRDVTEVIALVEKNWQEEIAQKKLRWQYVPFLGDSSKSVALSRGDFYLLFSNLFSNAVKFSPPKGTVTLSWALEGDYLVLVFCNALPENISAQELLAKWEHFRKMKELPGKSLGIYLIEKALQRVGGKMEVSFGVEGEVVVQVFLPLEKDIS
ncbi:MAG: HAMP domain-containing sensor histidine kinase [Atribacterota bacterium]